MFEGSLMFLRVSARNPQVLALLFILGSCLCAVCSFAVETPYIQGSYDDGSPAFDGTRCAYVVYDPASGDSHIWCKYGNQSPFPVYTTAFDQFSPDVWGSVVVWSEKHTVEIYEGRSRRGTAWDDSDVRAKDVVTGQEWEIQVDPAVVFDPGYQPHYAMAPRIYGRTVVFNMGGAEAPSGPVCAYNLDTGVTTPLSSSTAGAGRPDIYRYTVVWSDLRNPQYGMDIYGCYLTNPGNDFLIFSGPYDQKNARVHGTMVVWEDAWGYTWDIWGKTIGGTEFQISDPGLYLDEHNPDIWANRVVYRSGDGIEAYNITTGQRAVLTTDGAIHDSPSICGWIVLFADDVNLATTGWDIYKAYAP